MTGISLAHAGKAEVKRASTVDRHAADPFVTRADWQMEKVNYRIPDKVIKSGSFPEKTDGIRQMKPSRGDRARK